MPGGPKKFFKVIAIAAVFFGVFHFDTYAHGQPILQILHTNDLHSYWEHSGRKDRGGFARIKALMDKLETEGNAKGWVTVRLDAGDFSEGNVNYLASDGRMSFRIMQAMGYDAVTLGNHEFLVGLDSLAALAATPDGRLPLITSNFFPPENHALNNYLKPGLLIHRGGITVAVAGATTDESEYSWAALPGEIKSPNEFIEQWLAERRADFKIALTHLGKGADIYLARKTAGIDLVIGGHTHHPIYKPILSLDKYGRHIVPVVQAGSEGWYLGQMVVKLNNHNFTDIKSYKLIPVTSDLPEDPLVSQLVREGVGQVSQAMGVGDLNQVVGESTEDYMTYDERAPVIGNFVADTMREAAQTDFAIDFGDLYGPGFYKGPIMLKDLFQLQPHTYDFKKPGWSIFTAHIRGGSLSKALFLAGFEGVAVLASGFEANMSYFHFVKRVTINGEPIDKEKMYSLAMSEGFVDGAQRNALIRAIIKGPWVDTGINLRDVLYQKALKVKVFDDRLLGNPRIIWPESRARLAQDSCGDCVPRY